MSSDFLKKESRKKSNKSKYLKGGFLVGRGTNGCIYSPNIPTSKMGRVKDYVSKVLMKSEADDEEREQKEIKKIDPDGNVFLTYKEIEPLDNLNYKDDKCLEDCLNDKDTLLGAETGFTVKAFPRKNKCEIKYNTKNKSVVLQNIIYKYGGKELLTVGYNKEEGYLGVCNLIYGLILLTKNKLVHHDIKSANMLYDGEKMRYIDFGLTKPFSHVYDLSKSGVIYTNDYPFYPLEHNLLHTIFNKDFIESHKDEVKEDFTISIMMEQPLPFLDIVDKGSYNAIELVNTPKMENLNVLSRVFGVIGEGNPIIKADNKLKKRLLGEWVKFVWKVVKGDYTFKEVEKQSCETFDIWSLSYVLVMLPIKDDNKERYLNYIQFWKDQLHTDPMQRLTPSELMKKYLLFLQKNKIISITAQLKWKKNISPNFFQIFL